MEEKMMLCKSEDEMKRVIIKKSRASEEERAKAHAEICNCGAKTLHEYIENHFKDQDEVKRRWLERVMGPWESEDYDNYTKFHLWMLGV
ncbi:MAG TPA: hypothetical protein VMV04_10335, partial [Thermodesulfobacteriota bacterium]|nr:hypothetical protein [Thermodesulfobacteriota bacterium]